MWHRVRQLWSWLGSIGAAERVDIEAVTEGWSGLSGQIVERLAEGERRIRSTIDAALDAVVMIDDHGTIVEWNPQAERVFGWSRDEAMGQRLGELIVPPQYRQLHERGLERFRATGEDRVLNQRLELTALRRDGEEFPIEISIAAHQLTENYEFSAFIRDITERKRAEEARSRLAAIVESSDDAILSMTLEGEVTSWNRGAQRLFGYTVDEMVGHSIARLLPGDRPDELPGILARLRRGDLVDRFDTVRARKDGTLVDVSLTISPLHDAQGRIVGAASIARDIHDRKRVEAAKRIERLNQELQRSNADLEQFAYIASHDLREPLRMVSSYTALLADDYADNLDEEANRYIQYAIDGAKRMSTLIDDLLNYSRVGRGDGLFAEVDLNAAARHAVQNLSVAIAASDARVEVEQLPAVLGDATRLTQLFQNLIGNALKFHGDRPPVVHVRCRRRGPDWEIAVEDNGIGIAEQHQDRIFQVFKRLHGRMEYPGNGIGLAVCKKIVEQHQGRIWVESTAGEGTTFRFTLPAGRFFLLVEPPLNDAASQGTTP